MGTAVKKTISLPPKLAKEVEDISREEGKPISAVIQDALRRIIDEKFLRRIAKAREEIRKGEYVTLDELPD